MGLRIAAWLQVFINRLPFNYFLPTLFAKNFKLPLNVAIWLWYGLSIWNSPVLQYFYHEIYHTMPSDCPGEGSAAKWVSSTWWACMITLLSFVLSFVDASCSRIPASIDTTRHWSVPILVLSLLTSAPSPISCQPVSLPQPRPIRPSSVSDPPSPTDQSWQWLIFYPYSAGVMMLKRKLKRIREGRGAEPEDDAEDCWEQHRSVRTRTWTRTKKQPIKQPNQKNQINQLWFLSYLAYKRQSLRLGAACAAFQLPPKWIPKHASHTYHIP